MGTHLKTSLPILLLLLTSAFARIEFVEKAELTGVSTLTNPTHYGDPANTCESDEVAVQVTGLPGDFCAPDCQAAACPTDVPQGVTAAPQCILKASSGSDKKCALQCTPGANDGACGEATCQPIQGTGICTYGAPPTPAPVPTPPPSPLPPGSPQWYKLPITRTIMTGVGAVDENTAFVAAADNGAGAAILKTSDGGNTWKDCNVTKGKGLHLIFTAAAAASDNSAVVTGLFEKYYTHDGYDFSFSLGPGLGSQTQSVKATGRTGPLHLPEYGIAGTFSGKNGVGLSKNGGRTFEGYNVSVLDKTLFPARYAAFPSENVWYATFGQFPSNNNNDDDDTQVSESVVQHRPFEMIEFRSDQVTGESRAFLSLDHVRTGGKRAGNITGQYTAAIAKTTDAGATWTVQLQDQSNTFYMNDIHCSSEMQCIAAAEGPSGSFIYATKDGGTTWKRTNTDEPGSSCIAVKMVSSSEGWAACGKAASQINIEARFWHTIDGGDSWAKETLKGMMPLSMDLSSPTSGWASGITPLQVCTIAKFTASAPTRAPTPPPSPPRPGQTHYGDPYVGSCESDEKNITINGLTGAACSPLCTGLFKNKCPADVPNATTASPSCAIHDEDTGDKYCVLMCGSSLPIRDQRAADAQCGHDASCKAIQGQGICTYDNGHPPPPAPTPAPAAPTPAPQPTPAPAPTPHGLTHYGNPFTGGCLDDEMVETIGADGAVCAPKCTGGIFKKSCPKDLPSGVSGASPACNLKDDKTKTKLCSLECSADTDCDTSAMCHQYPPIPDPTGGQPIKIPGTCYYPNSTTVTRASSIVPPVVVGVNVHGQG